MNEHERGENIYMTEAEFLRITWPAAFIVRYANGMSERLLAADGVCLMLAADCQDGREAFSARIPPKHPKQQSPGYRHVYFDEVEEIADESGAVVWRPGR